MEQNSQSKTQSKTKYLIVIFLILLLLIFIYIIKNPKQSQNQPKKIKSDNSINQSITNTENDKGEQKDLVLNFKDYQTIISAYPYANKDKDSYQYHLFNIVYVNYVNSYDQFANKYLNTNEDWTGSYIADMDKNLIYLSMGKNQSNEMIWHTMEIIETSKLNQENSACTKNTFVLDTNYQAVNYDCDIGNFCFLPIDETSGIKYQQISGTGQKDAMCKIIKENGISGISLKSY